MIVIEIPSMEKIMIKQIICDLNGTLAMTEQIGNDVKAKLKMETLAEIEIRKSV